jgi:hypothetical protein
VAHAAGKFGPGAKSERAEQIVRVVQALDSWPAKVPAEALGAEAR